MQAIAYLVRADSDAVGVDLRNLPTHTLSLA